MLNMFVWLYIWLINIIKLCLWPRFVDGLTTTLCRDTAEMNGSKLELTHNKVSDIQEMSH